MTTSARSAKNVHVNSYAESEGSMWDSQGTELLDPRVIEPMMYLANPASQSGWGFHRRAELLNGRLAMLGFVIGVALELLSGQGILHQLGFAALLHGG